MTGPGELGAVSSCLVRTLSCPPAVPQQTSHFHFPRDATRPNKPEQGLSVCPRASLICCLVSSVKCVWGQEKIAPETTQARPSLGRKTGREPVCLRICSGFLPALPVCGCHAWSTPTQTMPGICPPAGFSSLMCLFRDTVCLSDWASKSKPDVPVPLIGGALDTGPVWKGSGKSSLCTL